MARKPLFQMFDLPKIEFKTGYIQNIFKKMKWFEI